MAGNMQDLRREALMEDEIIEGYEDYVERGVSSDKIFGMTAAERMFVSIGCFLVTSLAGFFLLLLMEKIALP
ncbi:MAG: hypothetical protein JXJ20_08890 [Anaerolineae bacterium]|jgi:hypothetical protein|nr:hypothetical protein [Anaerolineae bacterium]